MNKLNNMRIIVVAVCVIAFLALLCRSDNRIAPIIAEQSNSTIGAEVDNLSTSEQTRPTTDVSSNLPFKLSDIPSYSGTPYCEVNNNQPFFHADKLTTESFKRFSELDSLGRCGVAYACIGTDSLPTEERGEIGMIKPSGWHTVRYDDLIEDKYLYNRCHLIAFELSGENANPQNLITGTRYMNVEGMLPFENRVHDYVENSNSHVMYRVTPVFEGDNLVAHGVLMEGYSVEDSGTGICFNVFCYNVQPYIEIDYADGTSWISDQSDVQPEVETQDSKVAYILNTHTKKFHYPDCSSVNDMKEKNKEAFTGSREELIEMGYSPCGKCNP